MSTYRFSQSAHADIEDIASYTAGVWGREATLKYLDALQGLVQQLAENPSMGEVCDDLASGLRSLPYRSHVIYYAEELDGVVIARVLHENMNAPLHIASDSSEEGLVSE